MTRMTTGPNDRARTLATAMVCAGVVTAQYVGAKATRDALFLTSLDVRALPTMLMAAAACSMALVFAFGHWTSRLGSGRLAPASFVASSLFFVVEWLTRSTTPSVTAVVVYLHVSAVGPLLASSFWLIAGEGFDPRTAKRRFGQIAGAGTIGSLVGALVSERVAAGLGMPAMLLVLAGLQLVAAYLTRRLAALTQGAGRRAVERPAAGGPAGRRSGLRILADAPHLRHMVALVLLGTTSAALLEYLFKAGAVETFGPGDNLLRFFALYYAATSVLIFLVQVLSTRQVLQRFGIAVATSTPSIALVAGAAASLAAPGLGGLLVARGGEAIFRGSWFRAGYELLFTPLPRAQKEAVKSIVDVASDRLGDAVGGALVRLAILSAPAAPASTILCLAMGSAVGAVFVASRLDRWHVRTLESSLLSRGSSLAAPEHENRTLRSVLRNVKARRARASAGARRSAILPAAADPEVQDILWLRSADRERIIDVLTKPEGLATGVVPYAIPLLAWHPFAEYALYALYKVAEEHAGQLGDALVDPNRPDAVRERLARVFSICVSQRAADAVLPALEDGRLEVRREAARSLAAILDKNPRVHLDRDVIYGAIRREVAIGRPARDRRAVLGGAASGTPIPFADRAGQGLWHVFTLLSLVLPREPLRIAFQGVHSEDPHLRGTALEYLEGVLPPDIRRTLWPVLVTRRATRLAQSGDRGTTDVPRLRLAARRGPAGSVRTH